MKTYDEILAANPLTGMDGRPVTSVERFSMLSASDQAAFRERYSQMALRERIAEMDRKRYAKEEPEGTRWVTLGQPGEDGAHVLIDGDGNIHKGPEGMMGKNVSELGTEKSSVSKSEWSLPPIEDKESRKHQTPEAEKARDAFMTQLQLHGDTPHEIARTLVASRTKVNEGKSRSTHWPAELMLGMSDEEKVKELEDAIRRITARTKGSDWRRMAKYDVSPIEEVASEVASAVLERQRVAKSTPQDTMTIAGTIARDTDKAILFTQTVRAGDTVFIREEWLPKSQITSDGDSVTLPNWLALDKGASNSRTSNAAWSKWTP